MTGKSEMEEIGEKWALMLMTEASEPDVAMVYDALAKLNRKANFASVAVGVARALAASINEAPADMSVEVYAGIHSLIDFFVVKLPMRMEGEPLRREGELSKPMPSRQPGQPVQFVDPGETTPGRKITELHCWISTFKDESEGVMAASIEGFGLTSLVASRREIAERMGYYAGLARPAKVKNVRLVTFTTTEGTRQ